MKRVLIIYFLLISFFEVKSQIIDSVDIQRNCDGTGLISLYLSSSSQYIYWDSIDGAGNSYQLPNNTIGDTVLSVYSCGTYACTIYNQSGVIVDTGTFYIACPMRTDVRAHENIECFGDSTGLLKHVVKGGVPFPPDSFSNIEYYNYVWYKNGVQYSSGENDTMITNLFNGSLQSIPYVANVIDATGCVFQPLDSLTGLPDTSIIFQPNLLRIDSLSINLTHCKGTNTGSFYINVKDGKRYEIGNYYDYYLTNTNNDTIRIINRNGMSSNVSSDISPYYVLFDSLSVGNYTLHIIDSFGCTLDSLIYIPEPDNYLLSVSNHPNIICEQDSTWIKIDYVTGGHPSIEYYWIGSITGDSIYVRSGTYQAVIYDTIYKCTDTLDYILTAPNTIYSDVTSIPALCYATNTGRLIVDSIYGGVFPYDIQWGGINPDSLYAGTYTIFITDSLGCIYMEDYEVLENPNVTLNPNLYPPSCNGFSNGSIKINIQGGTPWQGGAFPYNIIWLNAATGGPDSTYLLSSGTYYVQTYDSLGCSFLDSITLSQPDSLIISFSGFTNPLVCNGGVTLINASITGGTGIYDLVWNTGNPEDTTYQVVVSAGTYTLTVTDENGCINQETITITEPNPLTVNGLFIPATCNLGGSASVTYSGGTGIPTYIWSNGETTPSASNFGGGNHWVRVTDSCGDTASYHFTIDSYILEADADHYNNPISFAEVLVISSTIGSPFTYQWYDENMNSISGETNSEIFNLCEGWYFVTTTDSNSCTVTDSIYATFYFPMGGIVDENTTTVFPDTNLWGAGPYTYLWDNGDITAHGDICGGVHKVWVTDVNGCEVVGQVTVDDIELSLSPSDILIECDITNLDVELEVTAIGGIGNYTYLWSNGETMNPINLSLFPGVYSVGVTDENSCQVDTAFHIAAMSADCIPNVFTPNNDGVNDIWNLEDAFLYLDTEIKVYGRYGKLIFKSEGYSIPWDGTNQSGNAVEDGAYFYVIDLGHNIEKIKGTVSIIR